jgi:hypothetical protein
MAPSRPGEARKLLIRFDVPAIHVLWRRVQDVDIRHKAEKFGTRRVDHISLFARLAA